MKEQADADDHIPVEITESLVSSVSEIHTKNGGRKLEVIMDHTTGYVHLRICRGKKNTCNKLRCGLPANLGGQFY